MTEFKVGDTVQYNGPHRHKGQQGIVTKVDGENGWVSVEYRITKQGGSLDDAFDEGNRIGDLETAASDYLTVVPEPEPEVEAETSAVNHPSHYGGDTTYEVIKVAEAWGLDKDAYLFNVLKYIARAGKKDEATLKQDLEKGDFYLKRRIGTL